VEDYTDISITDKVAWNLDGPLLAQIGNLLQQSTSNYLGGKIESAFFCLKSIRQRIIHCLKDDERKVCLNAEKNFKRNSFSNVNQKEKFSNFKNKQYESYDTFNTIIMDFLQKYGFVGKKMEDNTRINV